MRKRGTISRLALVMAGGGRRIRRLVAEHDGPDAELRDLLEARDLGAVAAAAAEIQRTVVPDILDRSEESGWRWLTPGAAEYPQTLQSTSDPPLGLFVSGRLGTGPVAALVGARRATTGGCQIAHALAAAVAGAGGVVLSGMARGVDAAAHRGALDRGGPTWAVWGCGPDRVYPPEHGRLADEIRAGGALLTEYPPGTPPRRHHFPERNRIVAGLADVVVVVEAGEKSGALNTARQALEEGREVMAVPGSILSPLAVGPNGLIRAGAAPVTGPGDLLDTLGLEPARSANRGSSDLDAFIALGEALSLDELAARMQRGIDEALGALLELEMEGAVERGPDGLIRRRA